MWMEDDYIIFCKWAHEMVRELVSKKEGKKQSKVVKMFTNSEKISFHFL